MEMRGGFDGGGGGWGDAPDGVPNDIVVIVEEDEENEGDESKASLAGHTLPVELIQWLLQRERERQQPDDEVGEGGRIRKASVRERRDKKDQGKQLFVQVHQNPKLFRNLYAFVMMAFDTSEGQNSVLQQLLHWEQDLHPESSKDEVIKCLRLHIGDSKLLKRVLLTLNPYKEW